ncbi:hypothetical protein RvY_10125 [Ramazzottius varieornatus]|uniref:Down syndrome critical region protein 3 n=1 Tax=Ramazzottius varieornatus TaxID=947166 RepID=A0A1D1VBR6_RAMVA|nr:hypothetical protein RvY_10125 [Ramazzottius varieornatus]
MAFGGTNVALDVSVSRPNKTYRKGDTISGLVTVHSSGDNKHDGIGLSVEGTVTLQADNKNILLETFSSSLKPTMIILSSFELLKPGRLSTGITRIPFNVKLAPLNNKILYETYHGVSITIQYIVKVEMKRSVLNRDLAKSLEFVVETPENPDNSLNSPLTFDITPESLRNVVESGKLPKFRIHGQLDKSSFEIAKPLTGELILERCDIGVKSIELQLLRVEVCGAAEGPAREVSEIQNIQIGDGDICRNVPIPIYMVFPRMFTCASIATPSFRIGFELNLIVVFEDDHLVMETFQINLIRSF